MVTICMLVEDIIALDLSNLGQTHNLPEQVKSKNDDLILFFFSFSHLIEILNKVIFTSNTI